MAKNNRSPGRPRAKEQERPTQEVILNAASLLFIDNGFKEVSIDDVAKACKVTKATVYYYYGSKAELFTETMIQMMNRIRERILSMLQEKTPLQTRLLKITEAHLKATVEVDLDGIMRGTKNALSAKQIQQMREAEENMYKGIERAFIDAMARGEISEVNPTFAAHAYVSLLKVGNYRHADNTPIFPTIEETAEQIVHLFWRGLFSE